MMDVLPGIKKNNFVVVGRVGMDLFPEPGVATQDATTFTPDMGGSSANIAAGIVKLGGAASLVTNVSDDAVGRFCVNKLHHYGVDTTYVSPVGGEARNSLALYESRVEGHQSVIYRNGAADFEMTHSRRRSGRLHKIRRVGHGGHCVCSRAVTQRLVSSV